jgi:hypothetical protein
MNYESEMQMARDTELILKKRLRELEDIILQH